MFSQRRKAKPRSDLLDPLGDEEFERLRVDLETDLEIQLRQRAEKLAQASQAPPFEWNAGQEEADEEAEEEEAQRRRRIRARENLRQLDGALHQASKLPIRPWRMMPSG